MEKPKLPDILGEFDAGLFEAKALEALKAAALGVLRTGKKATVQIKLELSQIGQTSSLQINHTLSYSAPTKNGKQSEEATTSTPMYADNLGYLTIAPQTQDDLFSEKLKSSLEI